MRSTAFLLPLALVALPFLACSSNFNHDERNSSAEAQGRHQEFKPDEQERILKQCIGVDAGEPLVDANKDGKLDDPVCAHPDPGSKPVDCAGQMANADFAWMWNFDVDKSTFVEPITGRPRGKALATYTYDDNTTSLVAPDRKLGFEPPATFVPSSATLCTTPVSPVPFEQAVQFRGGPFTEYGGGFGQSFRTTGHNSEVPGVHPGLMTLEASYGSKDYPGTKTGAYDLSSWTGVAIWVRRGPLGMSTMRVGITERHSAEDLNSGAIVKTEGEAGFDVTGIQEGKYCKRWRLCGCSAGTPCSPLLFQGTSLGNYCFDPARGTPDINDVYLVGLQACGEQRCAATNTSTAGTDPLFAQVDTAGNTVSECNPYLQPDGHSDMFCWNPATQASMPPPAKRERCNNPYSRPITVGTDWQLVKVPFTELRQADEAKVSDEMDLTSVKQLVFTHGAGWTDFWVANIGFYRDH